MLAVPSRFDIRAHPVETARLLLHPLDATDSRDLWNGIESSRSHLEPWLPWVPFNFDLESSGRYAEASAAEWDASRACRFSIRDRKNLRFLGVIGIESFAHLHESVELGYWLRNDALGSGLMTEAGSAVLAWAFDRVNAHRVRVAAATDNHASLGVIRRLGFRFEGIARQAERCQGRWLDHAVFALLMADARALR